MGSQRDLPERMRNADQATDDNSAANTSSPFYFSFSDFSSTDSNDYDNDSESQSGLADQQGPLSSSEPNTEPSSTSLNMVKRFACDRCSESFEKKHQLK